MRITRRQVLRGLAVGAAALSLGRSQAAWAQQSAASQVAALIAANPGGGAALQNGIAALLGANPAAAAAVIAAAGQSGLGQGALTGLVNGYFGWAETAFANNPSGLATATQNLLVGAPGSAGAVLAAAGSAPAGELNPIAAGYVAARNQLAASGNATGANQLVQAASALNNPVVSTALTTAGNTFATAFGATPPVGGGGATTN